jgi:hypothetical protein
MKAIGAQKSEPATLSNLSSLSYMTRDIRIVIATINALQAFLAHCLFFVFGHPPKRHPSMTILAG